MTRQEFREFVQKGRMILDGATGSNLQKRGMPTGVCPEEWILEHPDVLIGLQREYIEAGSDVLYAPTFSGNRIKLEEYGLADQIGEMNHRLAELSFEAIRQADTDRRVLVAGDLTMTGQQLYPVGSLPFEKLVDIYKEQVGFLKEAGVDFVVVETMMSLQECRAAVLAVKESSELPVMVTLTFAEDGRTLFGTNPETAALVMTAMGVDAIGVNCSTGPDKMVSVIEKMCRYTALPIVAKPNAGLPQLVDGETVYDMGPETFAQEMCVLAEAGAIADTPKMKEAVALLSRLYEVLEAMGLGGQLDKVRLDFSMINDIEYYNGIIFQGFLDGLARQVLSGGQYDGMMAKLGKKADAIGFAIYLKELERLPEKSIRYDVDALVLYEPDVDVVRLCQAVESLRRQGLRVRVEKAVPEDLRYCYLYRYDGRLSLEEDRETAFQENGKEGARC